VGVCGIFVPYVTIIFAANDERWNLNLLERQIIQTLLDIEIVGHALKARQRGHNGISQVHHLLALSWIGENLFDVTLTSFNMNPLFRFKAPRGLVF
jgi:hypothetical protein